MTATIDLAPILLMREIVIGSIMGIDRSFPIYYVRLRGIVVLVFVLVVVGSVTSLIRGHPPEKCQLASINCPFVFNSNRFDENNNNIRRNNNNNDDDDNDDEDKK